MKAPEARASFFQSLLNSTLTKGELTSALFDAPPARKGSEGYKKYRAASRELERYKAGAEKAVAGKVTTKQTRAPATAAKAAELEKKLKAAERKKGKGGGGSTGGGGSSARGTGAGVRRVLVDGWYHYSELIEHRRIWWRLTGKQAERMEVLMMAGEESEALDVVLRVGKYDNDPKWRHGFQRITDSKAGAGADNSAIGIFFET